MDENKPANLRLSSLQLFSDDRPSTISASWISSRVSTAAAVERNIGPLEILEILQAGDELRRFRSPREAWKARVGRDGFVVIRDGKVVAAQLLRMN
jgi:hypothetical protein